ncbi:hypothetical protein [Actinomadura atramentaria]|uniref:hypothetical protein n=1 Tax=Actinomadura atramentaria TaxID=1990 RepID=UPI00037C277A|nr:hypothetical protein [Actinomadura atramentaria]
MIDGISKPRVLHVSEGTPGQRKLRVEVMTRQAGRPCSSTDVVRAPLTLPDRWWDDLRDALDRLAGVPTDRGRCESGRVVVGIREHLGVDVDPAALRWETVHGDLHWANVFADPFGLVDWDHWGRGLVGYDAATLYCHALLEPETAARVRTTFAHVLDTQDGVHAQMSVIARLLKRARLGDFPDLVPELRRLAGRLIAG